MQNSLADIHLLYKAQRRNAQRYVKKVAVHNAQVRLVEVENSRVNPRIHHTNKGRNLGSTKKFPTSGLASLLSWLHI